MVDWGLQRVWGEANAFLDRSRRYGWADVLVVAGIAGLALGAIGFTEEWTSRLHPAVQIDLSPAALPRYALFSLARGLLAYGFSLAPADPAARHPPEHPGAGLHAGAGAGARHAVPAQ
jgi:hypothetical protein